MQCCYPECQKEQSKGRKGFCLAHYTRNRRNQDMSVPIRKTHSPNGSGTVDKNGYRRFKINGDVIFEHRKVMEEYLGRSLLPNENVHHINGDRLDNRLENLELWSSSQPPGQRVEDKVKWAKEIIAVYETYLQITNDREK